MHHQYGLSTPKKSNWNSPFYLYLYKVHMMLRFIWRSWRWRGVLITKWIINTNLGIVHLFECTICPQNTRSHRKRKVVGGKPDKQCVLSTMWMLVHPTHLVLSSATLSNETFCCSLCDQKSCCLCAFYYSKMNFIPQPQEKRSCRRQTQCSSTWSGTSVCLMIWWSPRPQIFLRP